MPNAELNIALKTGLKTNHSATPKSLPGALPRPPPFFATLTHFHTSPAVSLPFSGRFPSVFRPFSGRFSGRFPAVFRPHLPTVFQSPFLAARTAPLLRPHHAAPRTKLFGLGQMPNLLLLDFKIILSLPAPPTPPT